MGVFFGSSAAGLTSADGAMAAGGAGGTDQPALDARSGAGRLAPLAGIPSKSISRSISESNALISCAL